MREEIQHDNLASKVKLTSEEGKIFSGLDIGVDVVSAIQFEANEGLGHRGVQLIGSGFIVERSEVDQFPSIKIPGQRFIRTYLNGRDITSTSREVLVIDLYGYDLSYLEKEVPDILNHVINHVKPDRDQNRRKSYRENWWIHGEARTNMRQALEGLQRFIATVETSKHRFFVFLDQEVLPDNMLVNIAVEDAYYLGILSSITHILWALAAGGTLEDRPRYNKTRCFETFPFPTPTEAQRQTIRDLAERLDAHRKRQQTLHPKLTMTGMYNVLERERSGEVLSDKERKIYQRGLVSILRQLHNELDAAVAAAYGWPADLAEQEILQRLVDLNAERAAEEARGLVRWLRPEYQAPDELVGKQSALELVDADAPAPVVLAEKRKWPKDKPGQVTVLREVLGAAGGPVGEADLAEAFKPKLSKQRLGVAVGLLEVLGGLGLVGVVGGGWVLE